MNRLREHILYPSPTHTIIGVIGLGYVGLPVACEFARAGFQVIGLDIKAERVAKINAGVSPIEGNEPGLATLLAEMVRTKKLQATTNYRDLQAAHVVTINVETPVDDAHVPQYHALRSASYSLGEVIQANTLVIIESTVAPGTTLNMVKVILEQVSGLTVATSDKSLTQLDDKALFLGMCPERVMPGRLLDNLRNLSRVCGGSTPEIAKAMLRLYRHIILNADIDTSDILTAELVKTTENAYRDVQIAFANEVALICEAIGGDVWKVRELVNKSPGRHMLLPGAGVGGHCIPKDPWLLAHAVKLLGSNLFTPQLIPTARATNEFMPQHLFNTILRKLSQYGITQEQGKVLILGYSYLEDSDDTRDTPSAKLTNLLQQENIQVSVHDPFVTSYKNNLYKQAIGYDILVLMVKHTEYLSLDFQRLHEIVRNPIFIDGRKAFIPQVIKDYGFDYSCIGIG